MKNLNLNLKIGIFKTLILLGLSFYVTSCGDKTRIKRDLRGSLSKVQGVGFSEVFNQVLGPNCTECHSGYSEYRFVANQANRILDATLTGRMPKNRPELNDRLKAILNSWVEAGAPEVAGVETKPIPLEPTYESLRINVFGPKCLSCHSENGPAPNDRSFSTYAELLAANASFEELNFFPLLDPLAPRDSDFVLRIISERSPMPPIKFGQDPNYVPLPPVTPEELEVIVRWIELGLPEK